MHCASARLKQQQIATLNTAKCWQRASGCERARQGGKKREGGTKSAAFHAILYFIASCVPIMITEKMKASETYCSTSIKIKSLNLFCVISGVWVNTHSRSDTDVVYANVFSRFFQIISSALFYSRSGDKINYSSRENGTDAVWST